MTDATKTQRLLGDGRRSVALGAATLALVTVPTVGPYLLGTREDLERYDTSITPPGYAFSIWGPIFAASIASTSRAVRVDGRVQPDSRSTGWPLAGSYGLLALWSVAAQSDQFTFTPAILPSSVALTAVAYRRLQIAPSLGTGSAPPGRLISLSTGLLLGWSALAAVVNLAAVVPLRGADPTSRASVGLSTLGVAATATGVCRLIAGSKRGYLPLAASSVWGLGTTALDSTRPTLSRLGAGASAVGILGCAVVRFARLRSAPTGSPQFSK